LPKAIGTIGLITLKITYGNRKYFGLDFLVGARQESAILGGLELNIKIYAGVLSI